MAYTKRYPAGFVDLPTKTTPMDAQFVNAVETALLELLSTDGTVDGQALQWIAANSKFGPALLLNKNIDPAAAIDKSKLNLAGQISNADISGAAAIDRSKLNFGAGLVNADISAAAAIVASKLAGYPADATKVLKGDGSWAAVGSQGTELAYAQVTAGAVVAVATEAGAQTLFTLPATAFDGSPVLVEFFCSNANPSGAAISFMAVSLWEGATNLTRLLIVGNEVASANLQLALVGAYRFTPSAATHTYIIKANAFTGAWTLNANTGGAATYPPMFARITKV